MMSFSLYHGNLRNAFSNPQVWPNAEEEEFTHSSLKNTEEPALNVLLCQSTAESTHQLLLEQIIPCKFKNFQGSLRPAGAVLMKLIM